MLNLITLLIPLREAFGIIINNIPFRIGELIIPIIIIYGIIKNGRNKENNKYVILLLSVLSLNFIISLIIGILNMDTVDKTFFIKYIIRNLAYVVLIFVFYENIKEYKNIDFERFVKYIIWIEAIFFILEMFDIYINFSRILPYSSNKTSLFIEGIKRYCGTASEPGFLAPILSIPIYYFSMNHDNKKDKIYYLVSGILTILTFSTFVYAAAIMIIILSKIQKKEKVSKNNIILICIIAAILSMTLLYAKLNKNSEVSRTINVISNKVNSFLFEDSSTSSDYSSRVRKQNYDYAKNMYKDSNFIEKVLGRGTGAYSYSVSNGAEYGKITEIAEEASSLYYSTLSDRGIVGIINLIIIIYCIFKLRVNTIESNTIFISILVQILQYFIVGNMWLYFLWFEVLLLIFYNYKYHKDEEKHERIMLNEK